MIYIQLFFSFLQIGLFSIGGGYAAMPLIQNQVVEIHPWMTMQEFTDLITIAEMTPGPIAVNSATFIGIRIAGLPGAVIATFGCIAPSLVLVSLIACAYNRYRELSWLQEMLACLRPVVVALIFGAGLSVLSMVVFRDSVPDTARINAGGLLIFGFAFFVLRKMKWNPILTIVICGLAGLVLNGLAMLSGFTG